MALTLNGKIVFQNPDRKLIRESLANLDVDRDGEGFVILERGERTYMQVSGDPKRGFDAEYQEGDVSKHYRAENTSFSLDEVARMMTEYLEGRINWEAYGTWSKITW